jgi:hypothetical protein
MKTRVKNIGASLLLIAGLSMTVLAGDAQTVPAPTPPPEAPQAITTPTDATDSGATDSGQSAVGWLLATLFGEK